MAVLPDDDRRQFTMKLRRDHRVLLITTANDASVTASDWIRACILLSQEDHALADRIAHRAQELRQQTAKPGH
ncbi:MAG TPA: hypothetical protein VFC16_07060 [Nakamurella sp.]|nr:hypothetical protein [Nakamurella sp.]